MSTREVAVAQREPTRATDPRIVEIDAAAPKTAYEHGFSYEVCKRLVDVTLALLATLLLAIPILIIALMIKLTSKGPVLFWSERVGRDNRRFFMPKFRTMTLDAPVVATHLLPSPGKHITSVGRFLRKTSVDEFPQLYSILVGEMSWVGPRPVVLSETELLALRTTHDIHRVQPGLTGWAQINGRDFLSLEDKVMCERHYVAHRSLVLDLKILWITFWKVISRDGIIH